MGIIWSQLFLIINSTLTSQLIEDIPIISKHNIVMQMNLFQYGIISRCSIEPEDYWFCIAHLSAEDMLKSAVIEEQKFKRSPWAGTDNPFGPNFWCQQEH